MQSAEKLFSVIAKKAKDRPEFRFHRLYRNLFQPTYYHEYGEANLDPAYIDEMCHLLAREKYRPKQVVSTPKGKKFHLLLEYMIGRIMFALYPTPQHKAEIDQFSYLVEQFLKRLEQAECLCKITIPSYTFAPLFIKKIDDGRWWRLIKYLDQAGRIKHILQKCYRAALLQHVIQATEQMNITWLLYQDHLFFFGPKLSFATEHWKQIWQAASTERMDWRLEEKKEGVGSFFHYRWIVKKKTGKVQLLVPSRLLADSIRPFHRGGKPIAVNERLHLTVEEILRSYQEEKRQIIGCFRYASNRRNARKKFHYYHYRSLLLTLAKKEKISVKAIQKKYRERLRNYW